MSEETRRLLMAELLGFWRQHNETEAEGNARSVDALMAIAVAYGKGGERKAKQTMHLTLVGPRYEEAILETLKQFGS